MDKPITITVSVEPAHVAELAGKIDWSKLLELLKTYGPQIIAFILSLFAAKPAPPVVNS